MIVFDLKCRRDHIFEAWFPDSASFAEQVESGKVLAGTDGRLWLRNVPVDARLEFVVRAPGHAAATGDRRTAAAPVRLRRGWGNLVRVLDRDGQPVAGVRLHVDGVATPAAAADGVLHLVQNDPPEHIALAKGPFVLAGGDVVEDGGYRDLIWGITVVVAERPPEPEKKK